MYERKCMVVKIMAVRLGFALRIFTGLWGEIEIFIIVYSFILHRHCTCLINVDTLLSWYDFLLHCQVGIRHQLQFWSVPTWPLAQQDIKFYIHMSVFQWYSYISFQDWDYQYLKLLLAQPTSFVKALIPKWAAAANTVNMGFV